MSTPLIFEAETNGIHVRVHTEYLPGQSSDHEHQYVWAYHVEIENSSDNAVQLLTRHWRITDGNGKVIEVTGDGVVGEKPTLLPGERYSYTSGTPLATPSGFMEGSYGMQWWSGEPVTVTIPTFSLDRPTFPQSMN